MKVLMGLALLAGLARADLRYGATLGARVTDLDGEIRSDPYPKPAFAVVVAHPLTSHWHLVGEPGVRWSGSDKYGLMYATLPVLARFTYSLGADLRLQVSAGLMASALLRARMYFDSDGSERSYDISDTVRRWDLGAVLGAGLAYRGYFGELRGSRGLTTVHATDPGLFIVNTELGLWLGFVR